VNNISPVKDDKINKLQSSVDNLRREFQRDLAHEEVQTRLVDTKRKYSAIKIQRWYRQRGVDRANQLAEMHKLFDQKRSELKKKLIVQNEYTTISAMNKKRLTPGSLAAAREQRSVADKIVASKPPGSPRPTLATSKPKAESPRTSKLNTDESLG